MLTRHALIATFIITIASILYGYVHNWDAALDKAGISIITVWFCWTFGD
jgi:hypothetical protein